MAWFLPRKRKYRHSSPHRVYNPAHYVLSLPPTPPPTYLTNGISRYSSATEDGSLFELEKEVSGLTQSNSMSRGPKRVSFVKDIMCEKNKQPKLRRENRRISRAASRGFEFGTCFDSSSNLAQEANNYPTRSYLSPQHTLSVPHTSYPRTSNGTLSTNSRPHNLLTPMLSNTQDDRGGYLRATTSSHRLRHGSVLPTNCDGPMTGPVSNYRSSTCNTSSIFRNSGSSRNKSKKHDAERTKRRKYDKQHLKRAFHCPDDKYITDWDPATQSIPPPNRISNQSNGVMDCKDHGSHHHWHRFRRRCADTSREDDSNNSQRRVPREHKRHAGKAKNYHAVPGSGVCLNTMPDSLRQRDKNKVVYASRDVYGEPIVMARPYNGEGKGIGLDRSDEPRSGRVHFAEQVVERMRRGDGRMEEVPGVSGEILRSKGEAEGKRERKSGDWSGGQHVSGGKEGLQREKRSGICRRDHVRNPMYGNRTLWVEDGDEYAFIPAEYLRRGG